MRPPTALGNAWRWFWHSHFYASRVAVVAFVWALVVGLLGLDQVPAVLGGILVGLFAFLMWGQDS
jgi:hypothetical protein